MTQRERKKASWIVWGTAAVLLLPVLYVSSFGPAVWISSRFGNGFAGRSFTAVYAPLSKVLMDLPHPVQKPIRRFVEFGMKQDSQLILDVDQKNLDLYEGPPSR